MLDICIVVGVLLTLYGLMHVIAGLIERNPPGPLGWAAVTAIGLICFAYGYLNQDVEMTIYDIPGAFIRVLSMMGV